MDRLCLSQLKPGETGIIIKVLGDAKYKQRLFDMGITPGAKFYYRKNAPFGDPIEIKVRGYELTLRKEEAENIIVTIKEENINR